MALEPPQRGRLGEFLLYDEYDPRRAILFNADGTVVEGRRRRSTSGQYFLNNDAGSDGAQTSSTALHRRSTTRATASLAPNGTCLHRRRSSATATTRSSATSATTGSVGGTEHERHDCWAAAGATTSLNADDDLSTGCTTYGNNGKCDVAGLSWLNDVPDTHPSYEDRAYGGAGLDVLIGNTGGDRLIDWVGEFNSYLVPFAPFGIATVSRQNDP